jgi:hypothetical protein
MIERFHDTLNSMLAKVIWNDQRGWGEKLPAVLMAYRASVHDVTKYFPNRLVLTREIRLSVDLVNTRPPSTNEPEELEQYWRNFEANSLKAFDIVSQSLSAAAELRKEKSVTTAEWKLFLYSNLGTGSGIFTRSLCKANLRNGRSGMPGLMMWWKWSIPITSWSKRGQNQNRL